MNQQGANIQWERLWSGISAKQIAVEGLTFSVYVRRDEEAKCWVWWVPALARFTQSLDLAPDAVISLIRAVTETDKHLPPSTAQKWYDLCRKAEADSERKDALLRRVLFHGLNHINCVAAKSDHCECGELIDAVRASLSGAKEEKKS